MGEKVYCDEANENTVCEISALLNNIFGDIAYLDADTIDWNIGFASNNGMSEEDRTIRVGLANYLMCHFGTILVGLIIDKGFRESFVDAVLLEQSFLNRSDSEKAELRRQMQKGVPLKQHKGSHNYVLDCSVYDETAFKLVNKKLSESMENCPFFNNADVNDAARKLTSEGMIQIGYIASNFMYLIRAFSKNAVFTEYVKSIVAFVETAVGEIKKS